MTARNGRIIATENEIRVLRGLHRFGWLRTRDIATLVWQRWQPRPIRQPDLKPAVATASGLRMAQRTLRRLVDARQVLRGQAPDGSWIYALSQAGVRRLQHCGITASSGKDLIRSFSTAQFRHRSIANEIAISGILAGCRVSTEREIAQDKWLGAAEGIAGKKPDVLLRADNQIFWCEVERSRKNAKDYAKLLKWLKLVTSDAWGESKLLGGGQLWAKVMFVCTPAFESRLRRDLLAAGYKKSLFHTLLCFETKLYRFEDIAFS